MHELQEARRLLGGAGDSYFSGIVEAAEGERLLVRRSGSEATSWVYGAAFVGQSVLVKNGQILGALAAPQDVVIEIP